MLEVIDLECARGDRSLFEGLSFTISPGEILHIRGQNGRGKTTLLRTLCGLSLPVAGEVRWNGASIRALAEDYRARLAYVGHVNGVQGDLTALENLRHAACLYGVAARGDRALAGHLRRLGLDALDLPAKFMSQGQQRRLALARLTLARRPLWVLDEPFTSLDIDATATVGGVMVEHLGSGGMIVATSHQALRLDRGVRTLDLDS